MTTVAGIDLSLTSTGIALIDLDVEPGGYETKLHRIQSKGRKDATLSERLDRISLIAQRVTEIAHSSTLIVVEAPSLGQARQAGTHDRAGLWWTVVRDLWVNCHDVTEVAPAARAKYATGKGNAGKDEVLAAVVRRYPNADVTGNDVADALILAAMGARHLGHPIDDMPKTHLAAMDKVAWPQPLGGAA